MRPDSVIVPVEARLAFWFCTNKQCSVAIPAKAVYTTNEPMPCPDCGSPLVSGFTTWVSESEINFYSKNEEYGWLSNFYMCPQIVDELEYKSNEHYYQSEKAVSPETAIWITQAPTPFAAMTAGRALRMAKGEVKPDWDRMKTAVMLKGLRAKFRNPSLAEKLLATGDAILHEDSPTDMYWGKKGEDMLGKLLMVVRKELLYRQQLLAKEDLRCHDGHLRGCEHNENGYCVCDKRTPGVHNGHCGTLGTKCWGMG